MKLGIESDIDGGQLSPESILRIGGRLGAQGAGAKANRNRS